jgi:protein involved in polysaccharide export with SLBB domain
MKLNIKRELHKALTALNVRSISSYFFFLVFFSLAFNIPNIYSQSVSGEKTLGLSEDFLNSLPEETRNELLQQLESDQEGLEDVNFGVFSTLLDENAAEKYIEQELLDQKDYISPEKITRESLNVFGSNFFSGFPTSFMPISEPSLSSDYILDIGDTLAVEVFGAVSISDSIEIKNDGALSIPKMGKLSLAGLSLDSAQKVASDFVSSKSAGASITISIDAVRDIQVVISGYVSVPGIYTVSGNSTVLSALRVAGGIADGGSYRKITVRRSGEIINEFDLYELLLNGDSYKNINLKVGDIVFVQPSSEIVAVYGGVKNPALFEIKDESVNDLIRYAGFSHNGQSIEEVTLSRKQGAILNASQIKSDIFKSTLPSGGDEIFVPYIDNIYSTAVKILGASSSPGIYSADAASKIINSERLFSPMSYKLGVLHKEFSQKSNNYFYKMYSQNDLPNLSPGDELVVIDQLMIDYLNSKDFYDLVTNDETIQNDISNCSATHYLNSVRDTSRFAMVQSLYLSLISSNEKLLTDEEVDIQNLNKLAAKPSIPQVKGLFKKLDKPKINCIDIFEKDPEIMIALLRNSILVEGKDVKSGIYPVANDTPLSNAVNSLFLSKEFLPSSRISITSKTETSTYNLSDIQSILVSPGSNISVSSIDSIESARVKISGEVSKPGIYFISPEDRLSDLIKQAGGYKKSAYPTGGVLIRKSALELEKLFNEKLYDETIKNLSSSMVQGEEIPFEAVSIILNEFKSIKPSGRVITQFNTTLLEKNISSDLILENGDMISIPKRSNTIYVFGEVLSPGPQSFNSQYSVKDFINRAGGLTANVDKSAIILVQPNGETRLIKMGLFPRNDLILPGSVIYATRDFSKLNNLKLASTLAPIVSSIALSLASLNSINN